MGKTLHPTPHPPDVGGVGGATPCPHEKLFQQTLITSRKMVAPPTNGGVTGGKWGSGVMGEGGRGEVGTEFQGSTA
ncbi:MAG: hypothetical protein PX481_00005 [Microcystis sp. M53603_WE2]|uniref:hypothetical protein n=1 Tax=Microcystis sp. M53603_WE2 TaxID=3030678 RepID=UPI00258AFDD5|nr:hypothetical protein [Microcystis sp. M53603_WE2]MDJ0537112.1 hypothetical protein [Microcystis sp. M53603_WE2]